MDATGASQLAHIRRIHHEPHRVGGEMGVPGAKLRFRQEDVQRLERKRLGRGFVEALAQQAEERIFGRLQSIYCVAAPI